ncbi:MAG: (4Fe-4S)-binding protein [Desulfobacteraceae bacterium]|nr:(4Fe-4S)-binding protein [Desulfobacteraceae bacterium]MBU4001831.1 ATP-binding protein [Pseudomonadota bacterium]MBU4053910.1 ATP-binding protein [Pseudomonadota bacterium]
MKISIASGKGGTGKTMVTSSLAAIWGRPVTAVDLDVEEPNLHLFLNPVLRGSREALMEIPEITKDLCTYCRKCSEFCQFKAIAVLNKAILTFPDMCHGCGGCMRVCPEGAISRGHRILGEISWGTAGSAGFVMGRLRVGEAMSPPLIRQVIHQVHEDARFLNSPPDLLFDAPPGVSCPAVNAVMDSDIIVLVTEPTPFGVFDLRLAHKAFSSMDKPMCVVVNRAGLGNDEVYQFCKEENLPILAEIPFDRTIARDYAAGQIISQSSLRMEKVFKDLARLIQEYGASLKEVRHA